MIILLILLALFMFGFTLMMFGYLFFMGFVVIRNCNLSKNKTIILYILYVLTFIPLFLVHIIVLLVISSKQTKKVKELALDTDVSLQDFLKELERVKFIIGGPGCKNLEDRAYQVRNIVK